MKIPRTLKRFLKGFTLIELLVVIGIIALLASIAVPAFTGVQIRAAQTKAMSNAKQVGLACKQYAIDNNGAYPSYQFSTSGTGTTVATSSEQAFDNLFPAYLQTISVFYVPKSAWTPGNQPADPTQTNMAGGSAFSAGTPSNQCEWAYVTGLYDTSSASFPLLADGFASIAASAHAYTTSETATGGVWKGQQAIVVFCDDSAKVAKLNPSTYVIPGGPPSTNDLFDTSGVSGFMSPPTGSSGGGQTVINP
jgi:prepilin-type N-terminal cleavage/methylation domain-containing protein